MVPELRRSVWRYRGRNCILCLRLKTLSSTSSSNWCWTIPNYQSLRLRKRSKVMCRLLRQTITIPLGLWKKRMKSYWSSWGRRDRTRRTRCLRSPSWNNCSLNVLRRSAKRSCAGGLEVRSPTVKAWSSSSAQLTQLPIQRQQRFPQMTKSSLHLLFPTKRLRNLRTVCTSLDSSNVRR